MRILQINSVCGVGSTGRIATDLYKVIEEEGHECVIAYGRGSAPEGIKTIKIGTNFDNYMHVAKTRIFDKHGFGSTKATKDFIKKVEEYDPDVIHLHNIHGYYINIEILFDYLKRANKKVVWTLHDCWAFTGHCAYFDYVGCSKWKEECKNCVQKKEYPNSLLVDSSEYNFNKKKKIFMGINDLTIVTPSKWLSSIIKESFLGEYEIKVINNGIDFRTFKPMEGIELNKYKKIYNKENKYLILGVANIWDNRKGLNDFISLSKLLNSDYSILLVGLSKEQISKLPSNMMGIERTENIDELVGLYSIADVLVNTSVEETFGLVTIEAMACGTPVIGYNSTAIPEVIKNGNGIVVEKNNIEEILEAINIIKKNNSDYYFKEYIDSIKRIYSKDNIYKQYLEAYKLTN